MYPNHKQDFLTANFFFFFYPLNFVWVDIPWESHERETRDMLETFGPAGTMKWVMYLGQNVGTQQKVLPKHGSPSNCPPTDWANQPYLAHGVEGKGHGCIPIV